MQVNSASKSFVDVNGCLVFNRHGHAMMGDGVVFGIPMFIFMGGASVWHVQCDKHIDGGTVFLRAVGQEGKITEGVGEAAFS